MILIFLVHILQFQDLLFLIHGIQASILRKDLAYAQVRNPELRKQQPTGQQTVHRGKQSHRAHLLAT